MHSGWDCKDTQPIPLDFFLFIIISYFFSFWSYPDGKKDRLTMLNKKLTFALAVAQIPLAGAATSTREPLSLLVTHLTLFTHCFTQSGHGHSPPCRSARSSPPAGCSAR
jgi:hypothetical protein